MKILLFLVLMLLHFGCNKGYYKYFQYFDYTCFNGECPPGININLFDSVALDRSFKYYKREVCEEIAVTGLLRNNCEDMSGNKIKKEIEYLFVSESQKKVIYITTIPSFNSKLIYNTPLYKDDNLFNIWDLNIFHFGVIKKGNKVEFINKNGRDKYYWEYAIDTDKNFRITYFTNGNGDRIEISSTLSPPVKFSLREDLVLSFNGDKLDGDGHRTIITNHKYILLGVSNKSPRKKKYYVFFRFNQPLECNWNINYRLVLFNDKRIRSLPPHDLIFNNK